MFQNVQGHKFSGNQIFHDQKFLGPKILLDPKFFGAQSPVDTQFLRTTSFLETKTFKDLQLELFKLYLNKLKLKLVGLGADFVFKCHNKHPT